jgi:hypothetical protein
MQKTKLLLVAGLAAFVASSGVLVLNEGNFSQNNGTISYLSRTGTTAKYDIFSQVNTRSLKGGVSGYTEVDGKGLILVDNSIPGLDQVEIVDASTFKSIATLKAPDIENPRQVIRVSANKAYVTCWDVSGDFNAGTFYKEPGYIAVVDLGSNTVIKKIPGIRANEWIQVIGTEAFVGSRYNGDKLLAVIDLNKDEVTQRITVGANPQPFAVDANGRLWIVSGQEMIRMNPQTKAIEARITVGADPAKTPSSATISPDKRTIYFVRSYYDANYNQKGETYSFGISDAAISTTKPLVNRFFSSLNVDPQTGNLYATSVPSLGQSGYVIRYQPTGVLVDSVKAEISPMGIFFK